MKISSNIRSLAATALILGLSRPTCGQEIGDSIYRDGAFEVIGTWGGLSFIYHAGLLYHYDAGNDSQYVIHATGDLMNSVKVEKFWDNFVGGDAFLGYRSELAWSWSDWGYTIRPSYSTRMSIIDHALDQLGAHYWNFASEWKTPNRVVLGYWFPGNMRCDGLVEYCYEEVGLNPNPDVVAFPGGPMIQFATMDSTARDLPSVNMTYPSSDHNTPANALVQTTANIMLQASLSDGWSGAAYNCPLEYWAVVYRGGVWQYSQKLGEGWNLQFFTMTEIGALYGFVAIGYDNAGNASVSEYRYVLYDPPSGNLSVQIQPEAARQAGAQWRVDGGAWLASGATVLVRSGWRLVEFSNVTNWTAPQPKSVNVLEDQTTVYTGTYAVSLGHIKVVVQPSGAVSEGLLWSVDSGPWRTSGNVESNLPASSTVRVVYQPTANWDAPPTNWVTVVANTTVTVTGTCTHATGSVLVNIAPGNVSSSARWRLITGATTSAWNVAGTELSGYLSGTSASIEFNSVSGWVTPAPQAFSIVRGRTTLTGTYYQVGSLRVVIQPAEAVADGGEWANTATQTFWYASGTTLTGLLHGTAYTITYKLPQLMSNAWWTAPVSSNVIIRGGETLMITGRYVATRGAVRVGIGPDGAIASGARWALSSYQPGVWHPGGQTVVGVPPGAQPIAFNSVTGWVAPSGLSVQVVAGQETSTNVLFTQVYYPNLYVATNGTHLFPFTNWVSAATNVQAAIDAAHTGSVIWVGNGTYPSRVPVLLGKAVTLRSANGPSGVTLSGMNISQCVMLSHSNALLTGFTVRNGRASHGGAIFMSAGTVSNCVITASVATYYAGGVMLNTGCKLLDSTVSGNTAQTNDAGGVYLNMGGFVDRCTVVSNLARKAGGIFLYAGGIVRNSLFAYNRAGHVYSLPENGHGGGVLCYPAGPVVENCTIVSNSAITGGGLFRNGGGAIRNSIIYDNSASLGSANHWEGIPEATERCCTTPSMGSGCITSPPQWMDLPNGDFRLRPTSPCLNAGTNLAWMTGAYDVERYPRVSSTTVDIGAYERTPIHYVWTSGGHRWPFLSWADASTNVQAGIASAARMDDVLVRSGTYRNNGDVVISQPITLTGVDGAATTIIDGQGSYRCLLAGTDAQIEGFTLSAGSAGIGAGLYCSTTGTVLRSCTFSGNTASQYGGGVFFAANGGLVDRCVFRDNEAVAKQGGALYARTGCKIFNTLIIANTADEGGGMFLYQGGEVDGCTIVGNSARLTGGVRFFEGGDTVRNSIICSNGNDIGSNGGGGTVTWSCTPAFAGTGNISVPPQFASDGSYHLSPTSPCIDAGQTQTWMASASDLEGFPRITGPSVDMGAFERTPIHYVALTGDASWPFRRWGDAARRPQTAIAAAEPGDTVIVSNGTYVLNEVVRIDKPILVKSLSDASNTILDADHNTRVAEILSGTMEGFRLVNGRESDDGGGVYIDGGGILRRCTVDHCASQRSAGGVFVYGPGSVEQCRIEDNESNEEGGGINLKGEGCLLRRSEVVRNVSGPAGGGAVAANGTRIENCLILDNMTDGFGGGAYLAGGELDSCTVFGNEAGDAGAGVACQEGTVLRSIIIGNGTGAQYVDEGGRWEYNCTYPVIGEGGIEEDPLFADAPHDLRLTTGSPCIDKSRTGPPDDFLGQVRPLDGDNNHELDFDMGAYEFVHPLADSDNDGLGDDWENTYFGSATNGVASADSDGDAVLNLSEFQGDTHPWIAGSFLRFTDVQLTNAIVKYPITLRWQGGVMAWQYIEGTTNLNGSSTVWTTLFTNQPPTQITNTLSLPTKADQYFYRIKAQR